MSWSAAAAVVVARFAVPAVVVAGFGAPAIVVVAEVVARPPRRR